MSEENEVSFQNAFSKAINEFLTSRGGGFVSSYIGVAEIVDHDGARKLLIAQSADSMPHQLLGLTEYYAEYVRAIARSQWGMGGVEYRE